jgi:uncharacterized surface protein with fasciclin (FAS1) repeats
MCGPLLLPIAMVAAAGIAGGASIYSASKTANAQKAAMKSAETQAKTQAANDKAANERLINSANRKQGDFAGMIGLQHARRGQRRRLDHADRAGRLDPEQ